MKGGPFSVSIGELSTAKGHWREKIMPPDALHYIPPYGGFWGGIRKALQIPESVVLMAAPPVCARIAALSELRLEYMNRFFFLNIGESDFIDGTYPERIVKAADEILSFLIPVPKVLFLCETCIDDILGSDYEYLCRKIGKKHDIIVKSIHLKPTSADGKQPSGLISQLSMYSILEPDEDKDAGINIIGSMVPIDNESEFYTVMKRAGIGPVRHISSCKSIEEFKKMSKSGNNLLLRPVARLAVQTMEEQLGIPFLHMPVSYGINTIDRNYRVLEDFLGKSLKVKAYRTEAKDFISSRCDKFWGITAAVGDGVNAGAFELARALTEYGLNVLYVFANAVIDFDTEHVEWLKQFVPDLKVYTNSHTTMAEFYNLGLKTDLAFGIEAGYFCSGSRTVPLSADTQPFGYRGIIKLLNDMANTLDGRESHREVLYSSFFNPGRSENAGSL